MRASWAQADPDRVGWCRPTTRTGRCDSADRFAAVDPIDEQSQALLEVVELRGVEPDRADHGLGDGQCPLAQGAALTGERDAHRALVLDPAVPADQTGRGEPLEQRGERAAVEGQLGAELPHGLVVLL